MSELHDSEGITVTEMPEQPLARAIEALEDASLDAVVASSPANVLYLSGTYFVTMVDIPDRLALVAVTADGDAAFIHCTGEGQQARDESQLAHLVGYVEWDEDPIAVLARHLAAKGLDRGRIGVERNRLFARDVESLRRLLPDAEIIAADPIFDRMRVIKSAEEIEVLASAALATDEAIRAAFERAAAGQTETEVADAMLAACKARGGERLMHHTLVSGPRGLRMHAEATPQRLQTGHILRTDLGMTWRRLYFSDIARTAFVGRATPRQAETYTRLEAAQQQTIADLRPGISASEAFQACRGHFAACGLDFDTPHIGHSIGLVLHEQPVLRPGDHTVLEPGMTFMVEPIVRLPNGYLHTEDLVVITQTGCEIRSRSADWGVPMVIS